MGVLLAGGEAGDKATGEARQREGVRQKSHATSAAHPREGETIGQCGRRFILPENPQGQQPSTLSAAGLHGDLRQEHLWIGGANVGQLRYRDGSQCADP